MPGKKKVIRRLNLPRLLATIIIIIFTIGAGATAGFLIGVFKNMPSWKPGDITGDMTTTFYDKYGNLIGERHGAENRIPVELERVPKDLINAFIATEDPRFMKHHGIDFIALGRAVIANITHGWGDQGGSTITMQLAKNAFINQEERYKKSLKRKIQEAILAIQLERTYTKEEILEFYLNQIPFGRGAHGVQAAAKTFFGKDVEDLTLAECALIAGLTQRPAAYDPFKHPEAAKGRRAKVLANMVEHGYITQSEADKANAEELQLAQAPPETEKTKFAYFIDQAIEEAENVLEDQGISAAEIYRGGYKIYTTMDPKVQETIEEVYADPSNFPKDMNGEKVQSAMVVIDNQTGGIAGLIGGRDYITERGLNRATQMKRSPGSVIKPISVYAPALENGYSPASVVDDVPVTYASGSSTYSPKNYDGRYRGLINIREAIQYSINIPAVKVLDAIGVSTGYQFAKNLGLPLVPADENLSLALGGLTYGVSPLNIASAYSAFANQGIHIEAHIISKIEDAEGNIIYEANPKRKAVMSEETAYLITDMLQTVVESGTGTRAKMNRPVAGKTGTTQLPDKPEFRGKAGNQDAWFAGYTPELTGVVWMGFDKTDSKHYLPQIYGGRYPAQIWKKVMEAALADKPIRPFPVPSGIVRVQIDKKSGLLPSSLTPAMFITTEVFARENVPKTVSNVWVQAEVCAESGLLPTKFCPQLVTGIFLKRPVPYTGSVLPEDSYLEIPKKTCTLHGGEAINPDAPVLGPEMEPEGSENENGSKDSSNPQTNPSNDTNGNSNDNSNDNSNGNSNGNTNNINKKPKAPALYWEREGSGVRLYWKSDNSGNLIYNIERWSSDDKKRHNIAVTENQTYLDQQVEPDKIYFYRVYAIDKNSNLSAPSNEVRVRIRK